MTNVMPPERGSCEPALPLVEGESKELEDMTLAEFLSSVGGEMKEDRIGDAIFYDFHAGERTALVELLPEGKYGVSGMESVKAGFRSQTEPDLIFEEKMAAIKCACRILRGKE